jgi:hypothetical protein
MREDFQAIQAPTPTPLGWKTLIGLFLRPKKKRVWSVRRRMCAAISGQIRLPGHGCCTAWSCEANVEQQSRPVHPKENEEYA